MAFLTEAGSLFEDGPGPGGEAVTAARGFVVSAHLEEVDQNQALWKQKANTRDHVGIYTTLGISLSWKELGIYITHSEAKLFIFIPFPPRFQKENGEPDALKLERPIVPLHNQ